MTAPIPTVEPATAKGFTRQTLAGYLAISVRTLDRCRGLGLVPPPDLLIGDAPRWTARTIDAWLDTRPRLLGRGRQAARPRPSRARRAP